MVVLAAAAGSKHESRSYVSGAAVAQGDTLRLSMQGRVYM